MPNIELAILSDEIDFEGHKLFIKDEFHITLLNAKYLAERIDPENREVIIRQILKEFEDFTQTNSFEKYEISNEVRFVQTGEQRTIIVMAQVPNLEKLFRRLSQIFSSELPIQPAHVTLYRYPKDFVGIPINSRELLQEISRSVKILGLNPNK